MITRKHKPHIAHLLTVSLVWLILSANAAASDWFVRPAGGSYGSEDGSSYQNAWDGLRNVVWGPSGVKAGDTLYVCGLHVYDLTNRANLVSQADITPVSGTSESARVTIRGDYSDDPGIVWGAYKISHDIWTDEGDGVWSILLPGNSYSDWYFQDIGSPASEDFVVLDKENNIVGVKNHPGSHYSVDYKTFSLLYVKLTDGGNPAGRIYANRWGYDWRINGLQYITFLKLKFYNPYRFLWGESATNHIRWEGCTLTYGEHSLISLFDNHDYMEVINCELSWAGNGIYTISTTNNAPSNYLFKGNYIHDMGVRESTQNGDAHGIGVQGGHDGVIEDNIIENCGSGPQLYAFTNQELKNTIVRRNLVKYTHTLGGATGYGIATQCNNDASADKNGNKIYQNIIINATVGGRFHFEQEQEVYNNIFYNCNVGFGSWRNYDGLGANVKLRNNIFLNSTSYHINWGSGASSYTLDSDHNLFYPTDGDLFRLGSREKNFTEWQALSRTSSTFDPSSIASDPLFVDPENGNFNLIPGSLAIDAGVDVGLTQDFGGNPIPLGSFPDIGAYEAVIDPNNPPPVLQAIGDKSVDENVTLTFNVNATDPNSEPVTYLAQSLPSGATLDPQTGDFDWTPSYSQAGSYQVRFIASDGNSHDSETITITVNNVNRAPVLGAISDQSVDENALLSFSVSATDADGQALSYSVSGLPSGAVFASQTFTWTPSYDQSGAYPVTFTADDGQAQDSETITITVINVNRAPVLAAIGNRTAYADVLLTFTIDATDPDGDAITYSAGTLPSGATFTDQDFNWTPSQSQTGSYAVTFTATDGQLQDSEMVTMTVDVDSLAPTVTNCSPAAGSIQVPLNNLITLSITDAGIGVNASSVTIKVNNNIVYTGDTNHYPSSYGDCRRVGNKADYRFVYQSNEIFDYDQTVSITVNATDLAGNAMNEHSYSFATEMRSFGQNKAVNSGSVNLDCDRPVTVRDSSGNIWAAWHAGVTGSRDIYIGKLASGAENFGSTVQLTNDAADQCNPSIAIGSDDKLYVAWQDNRQADDNNQGDWDIYISTSVDGTNWSTETRVNDPNEDNQSNPAIVIDGQSPNCAHVVWEDDRGGNKDIYVAASNDGFATTTVSQITSDTSDQVEPAVAADSGNTIYVVWTDKRNASDDIYGAASNNGPWTNVAIVSNTNNQSSPAIAVESTGSILHLLWVDDISGDNDIYYASSNGLPGSPLTGSSIIDDSSGADQLDPTITVTGSTDNNLKVFACWQDWRNTDTDLYFAELSSGSGTNVFVDEGGSNAYQGEPAVGIGEYDHPYIMWADSRSTNTDIYYAGSTFIEPVALASVLVTASASSSTTVGTDPQAITTVDDVSIVVPAGACSYDVAITVTKIANLPAFAAPCLGGYDFGPSGIQFSQPVTITIPYVNVSGSATLYWFNSLTGALSQQGITDIQDIPISSSLHALSFKTTHFTAFYLFVGGGTTAAIVSGGGGGGGCSVSASGEGNIVEYILPYIVLAVVMAILKMRDARDRKGT